jgi:hypothetical protein
MHTESTDRRPHLTLLRSVTLLALAMMAAAMMLVIPATGAGAACNIKVNPDCGDPPTTTGGGTTQPPEPGVVAVGARTPRSVAISFWWSSNTTSIQLQRGVAGTYTTIWNRTATGAPTSYNDTGIASDTQFCYRLVSHNSHGTATSPSSCEYTSVANDRPITRLQLRLTTANVSGADTKGPVAVDLSGPTQGAGATSYVNPAPAHTFGRGTTSNYDLVELGSITNLNDLEQMTIWKPGGDDWCLQNAVLLADNQPVFSTAFSTCQWISAPQSSQPGVTITHAMLRAFPLWSQFKGPQVTVTPQSNGTTNVGLQISHDELEGRLEMMIGEKIMNTALYWNDQHIRPVVVTNVGSTSDHVDLDLAAEVDGPNPDVDVHFDLVAATSRDETGNWSLNLSTANSGVNVDIPWWEKLIDQAIVCPAPVSLIDPNLPFCLAGLIRSGQNEILAAVNGVGVTLSGGHFNSLTATFDGDGNLNIVANVGTPNTRVIGPIVSGPVVSAPLVVRF